MGQGYTPPRKGNSVAPIVKRFQAQQRQLNEISVPSGVDLAQLYDQVQMALANIDTTVQTSIAANSYTKAQIDSKIASPGAISPTTVSASSNISGANISGATISASGQVISAGIINSPGTKANTVTIGYSAVYIDGSGNMGGNTSTRRSKTNLAPLIIDLDALLALPAFSFQRITDVLEMGEAAPWQSGFMAEDVEQVAPLNVWHNADGLVEGVRYEELIVPTIMAVARERRERLDDYTELDARLAKLEGITS